MQNLQSLTEQFLARGGQVKQCLPGDRAVRFAPNDLWRCQCGCNGDYTDHSMRAGESGRDPQLIVR
jgi:hypothetical protein